MPTNLQEYYNLLPCWATTWVTSAVAGMLNGFIETLNAKDRLPKYIIVFLYRDILLNIDVFKPDAIRVTKALTDWLVRQLDMLIRRRRSDLLDKKPSAVYTRDPTVIFVRMITRVNRFPQGSKWDLIYALRPKFNDSLNNSAAKIGQRILTINSCSTSAHFDQNGGLSQEGKIAFWYKLDELIECYDKGRVKLILTPLQTNRKRNKNRRDYWEPDDYEEDWNQGDCSAASPLMHESPLSTNLLHPSDY